MWGMTLTKHRLAVVAGFAAAAVLVGGAAYGVARPVTPDAVRVRFIVPNEVSAMPSSSPTPVARKLATTLAPIKWMGLGDSIVQGWDGVYQAPSPGFLTNLSNRLTAAGQPNTWWNEGHGGDTIRMADNRVDDIFAKEMPDIVLLYVGSNDASGTSDYPGGPSNPIGVAPKKLDDLIVHVLSKSPTVKIVLAKVFYSSPIWQNVNEQTFDQAIPTVASWHPGRVVVCDMTPISSDYLGDGVHPGSIGYNMMAYKWYQTLASMLGLPAATDNPLNGAFLPHLWQPTGYARS